MARGRFPSHPRKRLPRGEHSGQSAVAEGSVSADWVGHPNYRKPSYASSGRKRTLDIAAAITKMFTSGRFAAMHAVRPWSCQCDRALMNRQRCRLDCGVLWGRGSRHEARSERHGRGRRGVGPPLDGRQSRDLSGLTVGLRTSPSVWWVVAQRLKCNQWPCLPASTPTRIECMTACRLRPSPPTGAGTGRICALSQSLSCSRPQQPPRAC